MALALPHIQWGKGQTTPPGQKTTTRCGGGVVIRQRLFCFYTKGMENTYMTARSMFAVYLYEDSDGNLFALAVTIRPDEKAFALGMDILEAIRCLNQHSGGDVLMLPIDRCEAVQ